MFVTFKCIFHEIYVIFLTLLFRLQNIRLGKKEICLAMFNPDTQLSAHFNT